MPGWSHEPFIRTQPAARPSSSKREQLADVLQKQLGLRRFYSASLRTPADAHRAAIGATHTLSDGNKIFLHPDWASSDTYTAVGGPAASAAQRMAAARAKRNQVLPLSVDDGGPRMDDAAAAEDGSVASPSGGQRVAWSNRLSNEFHKGRDAVEAGFPDATREDVISSFSRRAMAEELRIKEGTHSFSSRFYLSGKMSFFNHFHWKRVWRKLKVMEHGVAL